MEDTDRIRQQEHWHAIAEQLGLAPQPEEPSPSESSPPRPAASIKEEPADEPVAPPLEPVEAPEKDAGARRGRRGRAARTEKEPKARNESEQAPGDKPDGEAREEESGRRSKEESSPKRGRRRRSARTSRASDREGSDSASSLEVTQEEEAAGDETPERPKRRGRGRGRQKKTGTVAAEPRTESETDSKQPAAEEGDDTELDDVRSLTDWNVPSWNELIASLYRPER
jgi:hypothetical protein